MSRELDAQVAEKVMGECAHVWAYVDTGPDEPDYPPKRCTKCGGTVSGLAYTVDGKPDCQPYSTDPAAAWQVVEKLLPTYCFSMSASQPGKSVGGQPTGGYDACFGYFDDPEERWWRHADTMPMAVCLAAMAVIENPPPEAMLIPMSTERPAP